MAGYHTERKCSLWVVVLSSLQTLLGGLLPISSQPLSGRRPCVGSAFNILSVLVGFLLIVCPAPVTLRPGYDPAPMAVRQLMKRVAEDQY